METFDLSMIDPSLFAKSPLLYSVLIITVLMLNYRREMEISTPIDLSKTFMLWLNKISPYSLVTGDAPELTNSLRFRNKASGKLVKTKTVIAEYGRWYLKAKITTIAATLLLGTGGQYLMM